MTASRSHPRPWVRPRIGATPTDEGDADPGQAAAIEDRLGIQEAALGVLDPVGLGSALARAAVGALRHPLRLAAATARHAAGMASVATATAERMLGTDVPSTRAPDATDRRFNDPAWHENPLYHGLLDLYLQASDFLMHVIDIADVPEPVASKARFSGRLIADAAAPTNFLLTNPSAMVRGFQTGGASVVRGMSTMLDDVRNNGGWPRQVDRRPFELGRNMAATPGKVVYRNDLMELIQYEAVSEQVREVPLLLCPPWINKYYIMDLAPGRSLVEWAVQHGLTTFAISYRNPGAGTSLTFEDYLEQGELAALHAVCELTGEPQVNTLAVCLGGTLNACTLAYLNETGEDLVRSSTYLNSLIDFTEAGVLKTVFTDPTTVRGLARRMEKKGYLDGNEMAHTFDLLRANDLIFNYVVSNWLMGETPKAFDLLAWNSDSTRMPAKMHMFYLEQFYGQNAFARDQLTLLGRQLKASGICQPSYVVAAIEDHIVPWQAAYRTTQTFAGDVRFVLSSSGHIAGIVNPPNPKCRLWTNDALPQDPEAWLSGAEQRQDTWWTDWAAWIVQQSGPLHPAWPIPECAILCDAPGTYVHT